MNLLNSGNLIIKVEHLTKRFKNGKGIFNINFNVEKGEVFAFIGPNGAGKSTTIRHLMGFLKPDDGISIIKEMSCWEKTKEVKALVGYLPGEIVFPSAMTAKEFIALQENLKHVKNKKSSKDLIDRFGLNVNVAVKKMSKGMKQKLAIVAAFMSDPEIIILDEPSTGLDPVMQKELIEVLKEEKKKGKTIFLSSHIFEEIEQVADAICIVKDGRIVENQKYSEVKEKNKQRLEVKLLNSDNLEKIKIPYQVLGDNYISFEIENNENSIIQALAQCNVIKFNTKDVSLADIFEKYYYKGIEV